MIKVGNLLCHKLAQALLPKVLSVMGGNEEKAMHSLGKHVQQLLSDGICVDLTPGDGQKVYAQCLFDRRRIELSKEVITSRNCDYVFNFRASGCERVVYVSGIRI